MKIKKIYLAYSIILLFLIIWIFAFPLGIKHTFSGDDSLFYDVDKGTLEKKRIFNLSNKKFYAFVEGKKIKENNPYPGGVKLEEIEKIPVRIYSSKDENYQKSMRLILKFASEASDKLHSVYKPDITDIKFINPQNFNNLAFTKSDDGENTFKQIKDSSCSDCIHIITSENLFSEKSAFHKVWDNSNIIFINEGNKTNPRVIMHELGHFVFDKIEMDGEGGHIQEKDSSIYPYFSQHLMSVIDGPFNYFIDPSFLLSEYIDDKPLSTEFHFPFDFAELKNPFRCTENSERITDDCLNAIIDYYGADSMKFNTLLEQNASLYNDIKLRSIPEAGSFKIAENFDSQNIQTGGVLSWIFNNEEVFDPHEINNNERYSLADFKWMIVRLAPNLTDDEHNELARLHFESFYKRRIQKLNIWKIKIELDKPEPVVDPNGVQLEGDELVDFVIENTELIELEIEITTETGSPDPDSPDKPGGTIINVTAEDAQIKDKTDLEKEKEKRGIENIVDFKKQRN